MNNERPTYEELSIENENLKKLLSEKSNVESSLHECEEKFRLIIENSPDVIIIRDNQGYATFVSPKIKELTGYETKVFIGKKIPLEFIYIDDLELFTNNLKSIQTDLKPANFEYRMHKLSGEIIWIRQSAHPIIIDGSVTGIQNHLRNITKEKHDEEEKKRIEKELAYAQILMQAAFDQSPLPMIVATYPDFTFKIINKATEDFLLINAENYLNKKPSEVKWAWQEYFPDGNPVKAVSDLPLPMALQGVTTKNKEMRIERRDGSSVWELASAAPIYGTEGELIAGIIAMTDITERKKTEEILKDNDLRLKEQNEEYEALNEELRQTNDELKQAKDKAEESDILKTAFLQNMSHEIRTPMNAIIGFSDILNTSNLSEEKRKNYTTIIINSGLQLLSIVDEILTISSIETKQEKLNIEKSNINDVIINLAAIYKVQANNKNISLYSKIELTDNQSEIYTDKTKLTQILTNLLTNALKFTHTGYIEFGYKYKNNELQFHVKDTGIGIKSEMHNSIFDRFRQADTSIQANYGGAGLGLAISKAFVELLGGKIWVESDLNKGSTFYFIIPYDPVHQKDKMILPTIQNEGFKTVLVAEDEEYNYLYIEEILSAKGLKILHARNGKETVEMCRANSSIDLILMDIKMPVMNGHQAATEIKEFRPNLPIIAQSAYALEHEIKKYSGIFDDYLTKPINKEKLNLLLKKYIEV